MAIRQRKLWGYVLALAAATQAVSAAEQWPQLKLDSRRSGNAVDRAMGSYNAVDGDRNVVWCLDARDGSLIWKSEPLLGAIHVVTVTDKYLFTHAQYRNGYLLEKETGRIITTLTKGYRCSRFTYCEPYLVGPNFDVIELSETPSLISSGPQLDVLMCVGAFATGGRLFLTTNGSGLQACMVNHTCP